MISRDLIRKPKLLFKGENLCQNIIYVGYNARKPALRLYTPLSKWWGAFVRGEAQIRRNTVYGIFL